jgi:putative flippase GtrA
MSLRSNQYSERPSGAVDVGEFARFLISGVVATCGNLATVWIARYFVSFEWSLLAGIACGATISFLMSKLFAFRSRAWGSARGEAARFVLVYGVGLGAYWLLSVNVRPLFVAAHVQSQLADTMAVLVGAAIMTLTSYFGHRFFTYRSARAV